MTRNLSRGLYISRPSVSVRGLGLAVDAIASWGRVEGSYLPGNGRWGDILA